MKLCLVTHGKGFIPVDPASEEAYGNLKKGQYICQVTRAKVDYKAPDEIRRTAQNRLLFLWLTDLQNTTVESLKGSSVEDWRLRMKRLFLLDIYINENVGGEKDSAKGFAHTWALFEQSGMLNEEMIEGIAHILTTTKLSVKQFARYLSCISDWCNRQGVWLRTDDYLQRMAIGRDRF